MEQQQRPVEIRLVNLQELLDEIDIFRKVTGLRLQDVYNLMLKKGWTLGSPQLMAGMHVAHPAVPFAAGARARAVLADGRSRPGGLAGAEFQPRSPRRAGAGRCPACRW